MMNSDLGSTNQLLRVMIALLLRGQQENSLTGREQIGILNDLGLKPKEISDILGKSNTYVNKEISHMKRKGSRNGQK
jgi:hypothetical protein